MPNLNMSIILESTLLLANQYGPDLIQGISDERLAELITSLKTTFKAGKGNRHRDPFGHECYSQGEGVANFVQYIAPDLSEKNLYDLLEKLSDIQGASIRLDHTSLLKPLLILATENKLNEKNSLQILKDVFIQTLDKIIPERNHEPSIEQLDGKFIKNHLDFINLQEIFLRVLQLPETIKKLYQEKFVSIVATKNLNLNINQDPFVNNIFIQSFGDHPYFNIIKPILTRMFDQEIDQQYAALLLTAFEDDSLKQHVAMQIREYDTKAPLALNEFSPQDANQKVDEMLLETAKLLNPASTHQQISARKNTDKVHKPKPDAYNKNKSMTFSFRSFSKLFGANTNQPIRTRNSTFSLTPIALQDTKTKEIVAQYDRDIERLEIAKTIYDKQYKNSFEELEKSRCVQLEINKSLEENYISPTLLKRLETVKNQMVDNYITHIQCDVFHNKESKEDVIKQIGDITKIQNKIDTLKTARDQIIQKLGVHEQQATRRKSKKY
ncbi:MAG: hypothetical protein A3F12_07210 [Gammaproteobacteria bacterium RIFCSPHIGHO2_12_FULL_38_14]|nr:MAG: hypothetical protein A3F12_07210 [Gammaproteobacteria bacterium RIFCSPHIGHO2_12_FULL_38_14]